MNKTSIIILTYNNIEYSKLCIDSIRKFTLEGTYEIIIVDNHSTDGTVEWLKTLSDIKIILNSENKGFPAGCNQGIEAAEKGNDILLLNNDTIVTQGWLENLQECLHSSPLVGAVDPVTNSCSNYQSIPTNFSSLEEMLDFSLKYNYSGIKDYEQRLKLVGFCMLIKREVADQIGLLDERFTPGGFEDDDYSFRIQEAGYKLILCKNTFVYHFGSISFKADLPTFNSCLMVNSKKLEEKWGFNSTYSSFTRYEIINLIDDDKEKEINVLEIGCACGATLLQIKNQFKNAKIYGIELNKNAAKIAAHFADVRDDNIENVTLSFEEGFFDYIIFADVLEHLYNPSKVLSNMRKYLKNNGHILASIPNVMHYSVMQELVEGNFNYADAGILDRTHIRFFTLSSIAKMFSDTGYANIKFGSSVLQQSEKDKAFIEKIVALAGESKRNQFCTYQYIIKAVNTNSISTQSNSLNESTNISSTNDDLEIYQIKMTALLSRIESKINEDKNMQEIMKILSEHEISKEKIERIIVATADDPAYVYNTIGVAYYSIGNKQLAAEFFLEAFEKDKKSKDIVYNIVSLLLEFNETQYALTILKNCKCADTEIQDIKSQLLISEK